MTFNKESTIIFLIAVFGITSIVLGMNESNISGNTLSLTSSDHPIESLSGSSGSMLFLLSILYFPLIVGQSPVLPILIIFIAWSSVPLMIFFTKKIKFLKRVPYIYFSVTYLTVLLSFGFRELL